MIWYIKIVHQSVTTAFLMLNYCESLNNVHCFQVIELVTFYVELKFLCTLKNPSD